MVHARVSCGDLPECAEGAETPRPLALSAVILCAARAWHGRGCHRHARVVSCLCIQRLGRCASTGSRQTRGSKPSRLSARTCCGVSRPLQITEAESDTGPDHCMTQGVIAEGLRVTDLGNMAISVLHPVQSGVFRECGVFDVYRRKGLYANKYTSESTEYS